MSANLSRRDVLKWATLGGLGATGVLSGCSATPAGAATWSMWSSSPAERKVWDAFNQYVEKQLGVESIPTLTPSSGYPTKLDLQLVSGTASLVTALNGTLIPTYAARGAHRPLDDLIAQDPDLHLDDFYPAIRSISESMAAQPSSRSSAGRTPLPAGSTDCGSGRTESGDFLQRGIRPPSPTRSSPTQRPRTAAESGS
jgi:hypothetical protein